VFNLPTLNLDGVNIYYQTKGQGIPILFIHPPLLTSMNFKYQVNELSKNFQTIVFDIRGHGNSALSDIPLTYPLIAKDMIHILDHLNLEQAFLCGYSTGGSIALDFLLSYPERAIGAILFGPMPEVNDWVLKQKISLAVFFSKNKLLSTLRWAICYGNSNNNSTFKELYQEAKKGNRKNIEQYYRYSLTYNCTSQLNKIMHPILLLYGEKDKQFHHYAQLMNKELPNNELIFVKNAKHQLPTKSSSEINNLIVRFIDRHK
jgi:pimeloyl-ACP methyl ester carboxylesterase